MYFLGMDLLCQSGNPPLAINRLFKIVTILFQKKVQKDLNVFITLPKATSAPTFEACGDLGCGGWRSSSLLRIT